MSTAQIVQLFNDMAAQGNVVSKTINITTATISIFTNKQKEGRNSLYTERQLFTNKLWNLN